MYTPYIFYKKQQMSVLNIYFFIYIFHHSNTEDGAVVGVKAYTSWDGALPSYEDLSLCHETPPVCDWGPVTVSVSVVLIPLPLILSLWMEFSVFSAG